MKKLVIMPGGFHPFHPGHLALYQSAVKAFPDADVYVAATADTSTRPFPFEVKQKLAQLAGVPADRFVQVKSPFRPDEITRQYDLDDTQLIFVRSDKDKKKHPLPGGTKKDGSPSYLQPYTDKQAQPATQRGYMAYLPVKKFGAASKMRSATQIRDQWPLLDDAAKLDMVRALYPGAAKNARLAAWVKKAFDTYISAPLDENQGWAATLERRGEKDHDIIKKAELDPSLRNALIYAKQHYQQHRDDPIMAFMKWVQRSLMHSEAEDTNQDRQIEQLRAQVQKLIQRVKDKETVDETTLVNDPNQGMKIRPEGGMGTWNEDSLVRNLAKKFSDAAQMLRDRNYGSLYYNLYGSDATRSLVKALADLEQFQQKQGNRPVAAGREIQVGEEMAGTPAVGGMRATYQARENQPIQDYVDEGHT